MLNYIFGGDTDTSYSDLQRKREMAKVLMAKRAGRSPKNVGEGLNAVGEAIAYRMLSNKANKAEGALRDDFGSQWDSIFDTNATTPDTGYTSSGDGRKPRPGLDMGSDKLPGYKGNTFEYGGKTHDMGQDVASEDERDLLARTIEAEAGSEPLEGKMAVAEVIANRRKSGKWGDSYEDVIMAPGQFSAWNSVTGYAGGEQGQNMDAITPSEESRRAADMILSGKTPGLTGGALNYYNPSISQPEWGMGAGGEWNRIGQHVFGTAPGEGVPRQTEKNNSQLGMIGGVKPDGSAYQALDASGRAHASNPDYEDYSQLFREYRFDRPDESWVQVGEREGKPVYASPDYARGDAGNYLNVSAADARQMAQERGSLIPTRDEYKALYENANRVPMPTSADFGAEPGQGTPEQYTAMVAQRLQERGVQPGQPVVHGKEFFANNPVAQALAQREQPARTASLNGGQELVAAALGNRRKPQGTQVAQMQSDGQYDFPETQMQGQSLKMPFTPTKPRPPELQTQGQQPQQQPQGNLQARYQQAEQRAMQVQQMMANPGWKEFASPAQKVQAQRALQEYDALLGQVQKQADPAYQLDLQKAQLEVQKLQRDLEQEPEEYSQMTGQQIIDQFGLDTEATDIAPGSLYNVSPDGKYAQVGSSGTNVTVENNMGTDKFAEELAKRQATAIAETYEAGRESEKTLARVNELDRLLGKTGSGATQSFQNMAAGFGLELGENVSEIQAANAIINQLIPSQRPPGSGEMSDMDLEMFRQSVPRLINQPGGNRLIIDTMRGIAEYDRKAGEIAARAMYDPDYTREEAFRDLYQLKNPLNNFRQESEKVLSGKTSQSGSPDFSQMSVSDIKAYREQNPASNWTDEERAAAVKRLRELRGE